MAKRCHTVFRNGPQCVWKYELPVVSAETQRDTAGAPDSNQEEMNRTGLPNLVTSLPPSSA